MHAREEIRLIVIVASLRAGGMRVRWRDVPAARRALAAAGDAPYRALRDVFRPAPDELEVFDAVVLGALPGAGRVLPPARTRRRAAHPY